MSEQETEKQWNLGLIDPAIIKEFNVAFQKYFVIPFLERGLPPPQKRDIVTSVIHAIAKGGHFINEWFFNETELDRFVAWRKAQKDATVEELREYLRSQLRKRAEQMADELFPFLEKKWEETNEP